jgi:hypothetical protein
MMLSPGTIGFLNGQFDTARTTALQPTQPSPQHGAALIAFRWAAGFTAERVPLSGGASGSYVGDLIVPIPRLHALLVRHHG